MDKHYYIATVTKSGGFLFVGKREKVSEMVFNDLLEAKLKELLRVDRMDQLERCKKETLEALELKKPVSVKDRNFEIVFKKPKK